MAFLQPLDRADGAVLRNLQARMIRHIEEARVIRIDIPASLGDVVKIPRLVKVPSTPTEVSGPMKQVGGASVIERSVLLYNRRVDYYEDFLYLKWRYAFDKWHRKMHPWWSRNVYWLESLTAAIHQNPVDGATILYWKFNYFVLPRRTRLHSYHRESHRRRRMAWLLARNREPRPQRVLWCNTHSRRAEFYFAGQTRCDPALGGILMPCQIVDLTGQVEVIE